MPFKVADIVNLVQYNFDKTKLKQAVNSRIDIDFSTKRSSAWVEVKPIRMTLAV